MEPLPLDEEQKKAVVIGLERTLTVISGGPGTGKTDVAAAIAVALTQVSAYGRVSCFYLLKGFRLR